MESLNFSSEEFEKFEDTFKESTTLDEIVYAISKMVSFIMGKVKNERIKSLPKETCNSFNDSSSEDSNYKNLEKVL